MAGAASWKGAVKVGAVLQFPIKARTAIAPSAFTFNQHHKACGSRLRQGSMACEGCGTVVERGSEDIVKGYDGYVGEPGDDGFPGVDVEYIKSLSQERSVVIDTDGFVPADQIDPRYFQKSYNVSPDKGGEDAYLLIQRLMEKKGVVLMGRLIMSGKEFLVVLRPRDGAISMEALYWPNELRSDLETRELLAGLAEPPAKLMKQGEKLVTSLMTNFNPAEMENEYEVQVSEYLEAFKAGTAPVAVEAASRPAPKMADLESMLEASLADVAPPKKSRKRKAA